jgi:hypothetical protein
VYLSGGEIKHAAAWIPAITVAAVMLVIRRVQLNRVQTCRPLSAYNNKIQNVRISLA